MTETTTGWVVLVQVGNLTWWLADVGDGDLMLTPDPNHGLRVFLESREEAEDWAALAGLLEGQYTVREEPLWS